MLKLPLMLLLLLGTCVAQDQPSLAQIQSNSRMLLVFAPNASSPEFVRQLELIQRHSFELSSRNIVFVPISTASHFADDKFSIENIPVGSASEQAQARTTFHVRPGDFLVILIDENGRQHVRSAVPVDIHELTANLNSLPLSH